MCSNITIGDVSLVIFNVVMSSCVRADKKEDVGMKIVSDLSNFLYKNTEVEEVNIYVVSKDINDDNIHDIFMGDETLIQLILSEEVCGGWVYDKAIYTTHSRGMLIVVHNILKKYESRISFNELMIKLKNKGSK